MQPHREIQQLLNHLSAVFLVGDEGSPVRHANVDKPLRGVDHKLKAEDNNLRLEDKTVSHGPILVCIGFWTSFEESVAGTGRVIECRETEVK